MQTSEIMPTKTLVLVQGLDVAALAVNVLLIYFSRQPGTFTKKVKVGSGWGADQPFSWPPTVSYITFTLL